MLKIDKRAPFYKNKEIMPILFFSLFSAWLLSIPFYGQLLACLYEKNNVVLKNASLISIIPHYLGLLFSGYIVDSLQKAKKFMIYITIVCIVGTLVFFLPYNLLWNISLVIISFLAGIYISSWGFFYKEYFFNHM